MKRKDFVKAAVACILLPADALANPTYEIKYGINGLVPNKAVSSDTPGPNELAVDLGEDGFYGEVSQGDFISTSALADLVGLDVGKRHSSDWLKMRLDGKIIFVPFKTIVTGIYWSALAERDLVYGNRTIEIGGSTYRLRILKGYVNGMSDSNGSWGSWSSDDSSEWGRTFVRLSNGVYATYGASTLNVDSGEGGSPWCQEVNPKYPGSYMIRGGGSYGTSFYGWRGDNAVYRGWKPVLELVS